MLNKIIDFFFIVKNPFFDSASILVLDLHKVEYLKIREHQHSII